MPNKLPLHVFLMLNYLLVCHAAMADSGATLMGQSGLISMPNARLAESGMLRMGLSQSDPYTSLWASISMLPRLELGARYTSIGNTVGIQSNPNYGIYKDKAFDAKFLLIKESRYIPALSLGAEDFLGTRVFDAEYIVFGKEFGNWDFSLGYGRNRIDGYFGGMSYTPSWSNKLDFMYEYDAIDYQSDHLAVESGAEKRKGGHTIGVAYHSGWFTGKLSYQDGNYFGLNAYLSVPLMRKEFVPKIDEPPIYTQQITQASSDDWRKDSKHRENLINILEIQGFKNVRVLLKNRQLEIGFSTRDITLVGRAVGRVARTALLMGPYDLNNIKITYFTLSDLATVSYEFFNLDLLNRFFTGTVSYIELLDGLTVSYSSPSYVNELSMATLTRNVHENNMDTESGDMQWKTNEEGHAISLRRENRSLDEFHIIPFNLGIYFNDANGALRYETFSLAKYKHFFGRGTFLDSSVRLRLWEDISEVTDKSNSVLPHVRSDIADYKRDANFKLNSLLINKYSHLGARLYGRFSFGYYEEMFGGLGGQVLYFHKTYPWAIDLAIDTLGQRETGGDLDFKDYRTTTAIATVHYRIPKYGITLALRGGKFLAKDVGTRYEFQRRFRSGVRVGAWYTITDRKDITSPGSLEKPYNDKGIFVSIPLGSMLTKDTRATARFSIAPWTRDVGQMVSSPGDLYQVVEDPLMFDWEEGHLLTGFHE